MITRVGKFSRIYGDFNTGSSFTLYKQQLTINNYRPRKTWFGHYPVGGIDYTVISPEIRVAKVLIPSTALARKASDHLPHIVAWSLQNERNSL